MTREEAIEILRNNVCNSHHVYDNVLSTIIEALAVLVPELRENEDERIRKEIDTLYSEIDTCISELLKARTDKDSKAEGKALFKMEGLMVATLQDLSCIEDYLEKQKEQKPAEKSSMLKILKEHLANTPREQLDAEFEALKDLTVDKPAEWSEEDESCWNLIWDILDGPFTASKEGYKKAAAWFLTNCPKGTKSLRPQPKQEWSEEDEDNLHRVIRVLEDNDSDWKELSAWLKSRRPQYHGDVTMTEAYKMGLEAGKASSWKPSEEQMKALHTAMYLEEMQFYGGLKDKLRDLYVQLKKL